MTLCADNASMATRAIEPGLLRIFTWYVGIRLGVGVLALMASGDQDPTNPRFPGADLQSEVEGSPRGGRVLPFFRPGRRRQRQQRDPDRESGHAAGRSQGGPHALDSVASRPPDPGEST